MRWEWGSDPDPSWPIGVFDSGLGGLTVWRALRRRLPHERLIYFGDTARLPYGERSPEEILAFVRQILTWMQAQPVKLVVMACNTSSALALEQVRQEFALPVLGLILPGAQAALAQGSRIGVLATVATVKSRAYSRAIQEYSALDPKRFRTPFTVGSRPALSSSLSLKPDGWIALLCDRRLNATCNRCCNRGSILLSMAVLTTPCWIQS